MSIHKRQQIIFQLGEVIALAHTVLVEVLEVLRTRGRAEKQAEGNNQTRQLSDIEEAILGEASDWISAKALARVTGYSLPYVRRSVTAMTRHELLDRSPDGVRRRQH